MLFPIELTSETCMGLVTGLDRSECASWVQAWVSSVAVVFTLLAVYFSARLARDQQREAQRKLAFVAALQVAPSLEIIEGALRDVRNHAFAYKGHAVIQDQIIEGWERALKLVNWPRTENQVALLSVGPHYLLCVARAEMKTREAESILANFRRAPAAMVAESLAGVVCQMIDEGIFQLADANHQLHRFIDLQSK